MSLFETLLLRTRLWDINAQPTMFHRDFFASWDRPPHDFSWICTPITWREAGVWL